MDELVIESSIRYELSYLDGSGNRVYQRYIKTDQEAIERRDTYYSEDFFKARIKKVKEIFKNGVCIKIIKTPVN